MVLKEPRALKHLLMVRMTVVEDFVRRASTRWEDHKLSGSGLSVHRYGMGAVGKMVLALKVPFQAARQTKLKRVETKCSLDTASIQFCSGDVATFN